MRSFAVVSGLALVFSSLLPSLAGAAPASAPLTKRNLKYPYGPANPVRGVNLGGWFVLEPWITPSIFEPFATTNNVFDEFTLCQVLGPDAALSVLQPHWNNWITQQDFYDIAALGLNHVRIPIGYWSITPLQGDPYVQGAYEILGESLDWASAAGLMVIIDLHGAPGSQNGFDNSGRRGPITWTQGDSYAQTLDALRKIHADHAAHPALAAIELINEPMGPALDLGTVTQFYYDGINALQDGNVAIMFHDAFEGVTGWNTFAPGVPNLILDTHHYEVFDAGSLSMASTTHVATACGFGAAMASTGKWTISGEFTGAQTDCAKWLNGLGVGARYDGTFNYEGVGSSYIGNCAGLDVGTVEALTPAYKQSITQFVEAQFDAFEKAAGWIFWAWKTESAPEWHFQNLTAAGIIPQPLTARQYPAQCG